MFFNIHHRRQSANSAGAGAAPCRALQRSAYRAAGSFYNLLKGFPEKTRILTAYTEKIESLLLIYCQQVELFERFFLYAPSIG